MEKAWTLTETKTWCSRHPKLLKLEVHILPDADILRAIAEACPLLTALGLVLKPASVQVNAINTTHLGSDAFGRLPNLCNLKLEGYDGDAGSRRWLIDSVTKEASFVHVRESCEEEDGDPLILKSPLPAPQVLASIVGQNITEWDTISVGLSPEELPGDFIQALLGTKQVASLQTLMIDTLAEECDHFWTRQLFTKILEKWPMLNCFYFHFSDHLKERTFYWDLTREIPPHSKTNSPWKCEIGQNGYVIPEFDGAAVLAAWQHAVDELDFTREDGSGKIVGLEKVFRNRPIANLKTLRLGDTEVLLDGRYVEFPDDINTASFKTHKIDFLAAVVKSNPTLQTIEFGTSSPVFAPSTQGALTVIRQCASLTSLSLAVCNYTLRHEDLTHFKSLVHLEFHNGSLDDKKQVEIKDAELVRLETLHQVCRNNPLLQALILDLEKTVIQIPEPVPSSHPVPGIFIPVTMKRLEHLHVAIGSSTISRDDMLLVFQACPEMRKLRFQCGDEPVPWHRPCTMMDGSFRYADQQFGWRKDTTNVYGHQLSCTRALLKV